MAEFDKTEKTIMGVVGSFGCLLVLMLFFFIGLGCWGFIELIQWITSK